MIPRGRIGPRDSSSQPQALKAASHGPLAASGPNFLSNLNLNYMVLVSVSHTTFGCSIASSESSIPV